MRPPNHIDVDQANASALKAMQACCDLVTTLDSCNELCNSSQRAAVLRAFSEYLSADDAVDFHVRRQLFDVSWEMVVKSAEEHDPMPSAEEHLEDLQLESESDDLHDQTSADTLLRYLVHEITDQCAHLEQALGLRLNVPTKNWPVYPAAAPEEPNRPTISVTATHRPRPSHR